MNDVWNYLLNCNKPIVMYGTGNGADKILDIFERYSIIVSDIFVSDDFFRGGEFRGYSLIRYSDVLQRYEDCIVVLAFAIFRDDMFKIIENIEKRYEVIAPEVPVLGTDYFSADTLNEYSEEVKLSRNLLYDEKSREVFDNLLKFRLTGNLSYLKKAETPRTEVFENIIKLNDKESYLDLGAYRGDTITEFLDITNGKYANIIALEPDIKNYKKLLKTADELNLDMNRTALVNMASWNKEFVMNFSGGGGRNSSIEDAAIGTEVVHTTDIDSLLWKYPSFKPLTYVKMDVEGAEKETLEGMKRVLINMKPKLAISAYHRTGDLFTLPILINQINPSYKIFLRHHPYIPDWETNLYCI